MRVPRIALAVFLLLIAVICFNYLYVNRTAEQLAQKINALPEGEEAGEGLAELDAYWRKSRPLLGFSVPHAQIKDFEAALVALSAATKDDAGFAVFQAQAAFYAEDLRRLERFSAGNLF